MDIRSFSQLDQVLNQNIALLVKEIGEHIKDMLRKNVDELWYKRGYTPTHYTRTFQLINSITVTDVKKVPEGYQVVIFFDPDKIHPHPPAKPREWPRHQSVTDGADVSFYIPWWVEFGQKSPLFSYEGVHAMEKTKEEVIDDEWIKQRIKEVLGVRGFIVK